LFSFLQIGIDESTGADIAKISGNLSLISIFLFVNSDCCKLGLFRLWISFSHDGQVSDFFIEFQMTSHLSKQEQDEISSSSFWKTD